MNGTLGNYMTCEEAAKELGRSYHTILNWVHKGRFANVIMDSTYTYRPAFYISRDEIREVKALIENGEKNYRKKITQTVIEEIPVKPVCDLEGLEQQMDSLCKQLSDLYQLTKQIQLTYLNLYSEVQRLGE